MTSSRPPMIARVSRRELARNPAVWAATGGTFIVFAVAAVVIGVMHVGYRSDHLQLLAVVLGAFGALTLLSSPPAIDTLRNHVALASLYIGPALAVIAFAPHSSPPLGAAMFTGTLVSVRLVRPREILAHLTAATVVLSAAVLAVEVDTASVLALISVVPAIWGLAGCVYIVLISVERQGEELARLVERDPLTGLGNRRRLEEQLAADGGEPVVILALDLNGFKAINDTLGHAAGDDALRAVAAALTRLAGPHDDVVRLGGDEFCIVRRHTDRRGAERLATEISAALGAVNLGGMPLSTGIGIACRPDDGDHLPALVELADERLVLAKSGRPDRRRTPRPEVGAAHHSEPTS